jgi:hypothetical protein
MREISAIKQDEIRWKERAIPDLASQSAVFYYASPFRISRPAALHFKRNSVLAV